MSLFRVMMVADYTDIGKWLCCTDFFISQLLTLCSCCNIVRLLESRTSAQNVFWLRLIMVFTSGQVFFFSSEIGKGEEWIS